MKKENGSILVLTILAVLILSILVTGLLNVGTTELYTTQNYHLSKVSYYTAVQGVEEMRNKIIDADTNDEVGKTVFSPLGVQQGDPGTQQIDEGGLTRYYITGTLENMEADTTQSPQQLPGFTAPTPVGISLGSQSQIQVSTITWLVNITSKAKTGKRVSYTEIRAGILSLEAGAYK